jgi:lipoprotein NlpI
VLGLFGETSLEVSAIRKKIVKFRLMQKNYKEALDIYNKCLEIDISIGSAELNIGIAL